MILPPMILPTASSVQREKRQNHKWQNLIVYEIEDEGRERWEGGSVRGSRALVGSAFENGHGGGVMDGMGQA